MTNNSRDDQHKVTIDFRCELCWKISPQLNAAQRVKKKNYRRSARHTPIKLYIKSLSKNINQRVYFEFMHDYSLLKVSNYHFFHYILSTKRRNMKEVLSKLDIDHFIHNGFVRLEYAFPKQIAAAAREILWKDLDAAPNDPTTWAKPVIRLGMYSQPAFIQAANTTVLHGAFDQLVGVGHWQPLQSIGTFAVRFPSSEDPGDTGWHVDASFPGENPTNFFDWRINVRTRARALLLLFFFSDIGNDDAPTRIRVGSHLDIARMLFAYGDEGLSFVEVAERLPAPRTHDETVATGEAGTVYLCHPFLVHAAQPHRGTEPRFLAQPPLMLKKEIVLGNQDGNYTPLEKSINIAISHMM